MDKGSWYSSAEASKNLGVNEKTLNLWRELGYLKFGTHWRYIESTANEINKNMIIYHLKWCREEMDYWRSHHAQIKIIAA